MTTESTTTPEYDAAYGEAREAGSRTMTDAFVERMAERVGAKASVRAVFGDPIERNGITVIPVARVRWGFGGGAGRGPIPVGPGTGDEAAAGMTTSVMSRSKAPSARTASASLGLVAVVTA